MDQGEWLTSADPFRMLRLLHPRPVSPRKYRLFGAACCRRAWLAEAVARCDAAAAALEQFADMRPEGLDRVALAGAWGVARVASREVERLELAARFVYAAVQPPNAWWTAHWSAEAWLDWAGTGGAGAAKKPWQNPRLERAYTAFPSVSEGCDPREGGFATASKRSALHTILWNAFQKDSRHADDARSH